MEEGREKRTERIAARARRKCEHERSVQQRVARARGNGEERCAKLKGDEEYHGEKKKKPGGRRARGRREADDGVARE